ncbi:unnamed protein product [Ophioblennius macclurei]
MAVDGCGNVCKYVLIIFNIIFALVGFAFLGLGLWLRFSDGTRGIFEVEALNSSAFVTGVTVLIALGAVMLIVVAIGDYGTCNEKRCALTLFSVLIAILAVADGVLGFLAFTQREEWGQWLGEFYVSVYTLYVGSGDPAIAVTLTFFHQILQCCGITGVPLIEIAKKTCPKSDSFFKSLLMDSCPTVILTVFDSKAPLVMGIFLGIGVLLIVALICAAILNKQIKRSNEDINSYYSAVY